MVKALIAGSAHLVICATPPYGVRNRAGHVSIDVGGGAYETALCLGALGVVPRLLTAWSASELSRLLASHITAAGIDLVADEVTGMGIGASVTQYGNGAEPATVWAIPISKHVFAEGRIEQVLDGMDAVYLDATLSAASIKTLGERAHSLHLPVIASGASSELVGKLCCLAGKVTALVLSGSECDRLMAEVDAADPSEIAQQFDAMVFVTRGKGGAVIYHADGERTRARPPADESVPGKTGHAFALGVIAKLLQGETLQDAANAAHEMTVRRACQAAESSGINTVVRDLVDQAERDKLTGLLTRSGLSSALARTGHSNGGLILIDLDNFKQVNDSRGHDAGDKVLKAAAEVIESCVRDGDPACRWGGDEFVVFLPDVDPRLTYRVAERMRHLAANKEMFGVTFSIGITSTVAGEAFEQAISRADEVMYQAKKGGKNLVAADIYSDEVNLG